MGILSLASAPWAGAVPQEVEVHGQRVLAIAAPGRATPEFLAALDSSTGRLMRTGDVVAISERAAFWFDATCDRLPTTNGGGGMIRGIWPLDHSPVRNAFLPGFRDGQQGSGVSLLGNYGAKNIDNGTTYAIEHEWQPRRGATMGRVVNGRLVVAFEGRVANSNTPIEGIDDPYDVDPEPGRVGHASYRLTYLLPHDATAFEQRIEIRVDEGVFGPLGTMVVSNNLPAIETEEIAYLGSPTLVGGPIEDGAVRRSEGLPWGDWGRGATPFVRPFAKLPGPVSWVETPLGRGRAAAMRSAAGGWAMQMAVVRRVLPARIRGLDAIQAIDNRGIGDRVHALDWQVWDVNRGQKPVVFQKGEVVRVETQHTFRFEGL